MTVIDNPLEQFQWERQPEAEKLVREMVEEFFRASEDRGMSEGAMLAPRMKEETGTRFVDWVDHIETIDCAEYRRAMELAGFRESQQGNLWKAYAHSGGIFPKIVLSEEDLDPELAPALPRVHIKVDSVAEFAVAHGLPIEDVSGGPVSPRRSVRWGLLIAEERHGYSDFGRPQLGEAKVLQWLAHFESFRLRCRHFKDEEKGFDETERLIGDAIDQLGRDLTCDLWFTAEREYWMRRNRAAQVQYARQQKLGLGWANHDHHTYRCSRKHFARLVRIWEKLGFVCRERFYAGKEAGWGAQVMEQPVAGIVTFNDVDLSPDELMGDFAHDPLPERKELGTVGLWCALHGESFLVAGMHHLECQFDFESLRKQLEEEAGVKTMKPFTDYPWLRQAFTEGEQWPVREERIAMLLKKGQITAEQAEKFRTEGAIGSHLENLERNEGFKGFNQKGVSEIITATDPRKQ